MGENGDQQIQKTEIVENKQTNKTAEATIEDTLKQKMPDDTEKQQFFLNIFQQKDIQTTFTQQEINGYIQENLNVRDFRKLKIASIEEQTKIILEDMDNQIKKVDGSLKNIQTYSRTLETNINSNITNTTENITNNTEIIKLDEQYKQFTKTKESFSNLGDKQIQVTDENKKNIPQDVITIAEGKIKAIKESNPKADIQINDYLSFYLTSQQESVKNTDFAKDFEKLNTMRGIENTTMKNNTDTNNADKIVATNESLNDFTNNSDNFDKIKAPTLPEIQDFDTEFATYVKFIPDEKIRTSIEDNKDLIKTFEKTLNEEKTEDDVRTGEDEKGRAAYDEYTQAIEDIKENLPERTQTIIKQRVMGSCISGLAKYFDTTTVNKENFADDFDIFETQGKFDFFGKFSGCRNYTGDFRGINLKQKRKNLLHLKQSVSAPKTDLAYKKVSA